MVRVSEYCSDYCMAGVEAIILREGGDDVLIGFPLESPFGWYDSAYTTEYRCWWISSDYLEPVQVFSRSKFR